MWLRLQQHARETCQRCVWQWRAHSAEQLGHGVQFPIEDYMSDHDVARRAAVGFKEYVDELRSQRSKKPNTGLKGVNERGRKFEARNTPFPVRPSADPACALCRCVVRLRRLQTSHPDDGAVFQQDPPRGCRASARTTTRTRRRRRTTSATSSSVAHAARSTAPSTTTSIRPRAASTRTCTSPSRRAAALFLGFLVSGPD